MRRSVPLLLLLLLLGACCAAFGPSPFAGLAPTARAKAIAAAASDGAADGGATKGRGAKKPLVVVVGDQATQLYHDLYPGTGSMSIEHPEDQRLFERRGGRGRPRHKIGMPGHFSPPQPKAGRSKYPDLVSSYFRRLEREMAGADSILVMGHSKGKGQAAELLVEDLARTKPNIAAKVKGLVRLDDTHVSDRQILQLARHVLLGRPDPRRKRRIHGQPLQ